MGPAQGLLNEFFVSNLFYCLEKLDKAYNNSVNLSSYIVNLIQKIVDNIYYLLEMSALLSTDAARLAINYDFFLK